MTSSFQKVAADQGELPDMPIQADWIIEGLPVARGKVVVQSADQLISMGLWSCTAGRFHWTFNCDEFIQILEGEVTVTNESGKSIHLQVGDFAHFPCGLKTEWYVPRFVRKIFTLRTAEPLVS